MLRLPPVLRTQDRMPPSRSFTALAESEQALGPEHPDTLTHLNDLAIGLLDNGEYAAAAPSSPRAGDA